jgi:hypothetical protein
MTAKSVPPKLLWTYECRNAEPSPMLAGFRIEVAAEKLTASKSITVRSDCVNFCCGGYSGSPIGVERSLES